MASAKRLLNTCQWSSSRESTFTECKKKYWYIYYGAWEGWPKNAYDTRSAVNPLAGYLYMLKNMQPFCMYLGSTVHKTIEWFLKTHQKTKRTPTLDEMVSHVLDAYKKGIASSEEKLWKVSPKQNANLFEHYYHQAIDFSASEDKAKLCIENFFASPCIQNIALSPKATWKGIEELQSFPLEKGVSAIVVYDFFLEWRASENSSYLIIFDWKTGQESAKIDSQLFAYALAAESLYSLPLEKIILSPFYLSQGPTAYKKYGVNQEIPLDRQKIDETKNSIIISAKRMLEMHPTYTEKDPYVPPSPISFPYASDRRACRKCPFQELCQATNYQDKEREELYSFIPPN
jgi:hypothetical protein